MSLYPLIRPLLFRLDPEWIHRATLAAVGRAGRIPPVRGMLRGLLTVDDPRLRVEAGGLAFPNPVGLAAGFDKNGIAMEGLASAGFGFVEVGSVSAHPSAGNPGLPRLFRVPEDEAIVVNYGVPNDGADAVARRFASARPSRLPGSAGSTQSPCPPSQPRPARPPVPLGINLVETNTGRPAGAEEVVEELVAAMRPFLGLADYATLNLNCPNTTSGRSPFDDPGTLGKLLAGYSGYDAMPPTFLKVVPTTDPATIEGTLAAVDPFPFVKGIVFGLPTGKPYESLKTPPQVLDRMPGTLCGRPTRALIDASIQAWYPRMDRNRHVIVGTGGIFTAEDVYRKIQLGATLVQVYTALVYHGPALVKRINRGLCRLMAKDGLDRITDAVGVDNPHPRTPGTRNTPKPSMSDVISSLDSVTPEWLTSRLRESGVLNQGGILDVKIHPNPAFNSMAAHLEPVYSADAPAGVPERLFIKIKQHHWGRDEVSFYRLATGQRLPLPMLIPFIDGAYDEDTGLSHCLMLDVSGTHHAPVSRARLLAGDGVPEEGELAGCVEALAGLHAYWWEHPDLRVSRPLEDGPDQEDRPVRIPTPFRDEERYMTEVRDQVEEWRRFSASAAAELPRELIELYDRRIKALPTLWDRYLRHRFARFSKLTVCHSDCYFTQFLCPADPEVHGTYLSDMEEACIYLGAEDLVYLFATFWTREQRQENDREIRCLKRYYETLVNRGVKDYSWDDLCRDYRLQLIWRVELPVWDQQNGSSRDYWRPKMQCLADAYRDWDCAAML